MRLASRILIGVSIVFLALMSGTTAQPAVDHAGVRDRAPPKPGGLTVVSRTSSSLGIGGKRPLVASPTGSTWAEASRIDDRDDLHLQRA